MYQRSQSTRSNLGPATHAILSVALLWAAFLGTTTLSCTSDAAPGPTVTRVDSAGVTIVQNSGPIPTDGGGWAVASEPSLSIGTLEGEESYQFFGVAGARSFSDGRIGVVNSSSREIRIYTAEGTFIQAFGQRGSGPEEFEMPALAGSVGDTLIVVDRAHHRLTRTPSGTPYEESLESAKIRSEFRCLT